MSSWHISITKYKFFLISSFLLPVETIPHSDKIGQVGWKQITIMFKGM